MIAYTICNKTTDVVLYIDKAYIKKSIRKVGGFGLFCSQFYRNLVQIPHFDKKSSK